MRLLTVQIDVESLPEQSPYVASKAILGIAQDIAKMGEFPARELDRTLLDNESRMIGYWSLHPSDALKK